MKDSFLRWALKYARAGFPVFPCEVRGKAPEGRLAPNGYKDATTDPKKIRQWWGSGRKYNVGLVPPKGMAILDVDPRNGGTTEGLPGGLHALTGGGGTHIIVKDVPERLPGKLRKGIDIKRNGYVIAEPSIHPDTGKGYRWDGGFRPDQIQRWPKGLTTTRPKAKKSEGARDPLSRSQLRRLLKNISPDDYDDWIAVGQSLKGDYPDDGYDLWLGWSKGSKNFESAGQCRAKWRSFRGEGRGTGTLVHMAGGKVPRTSAQEDFKHAPKVKMVRKPSTSILFRHLADIVAEKRQPEWLLPDVLEANVLAVLSGPRGTFKSFIALDWAMQVAAAGQGVVILSGEGAGLDRRADAWMRTHAPGKRLKGFPIVAREGILNLTDNEVVAQVAKAIESCQYGIKLILVDTYSKFTPGLKENDNTDVAQFVSRLATKLREAFGLTVLLVAHTGHAEQNRARGAYALTANTDAEYNVTRKDPTGMAVTVTRERFKDTPSLPRLAYLAEVVDLGRLDKQLRTVTSLALRETDTPDDEDRRVAKPQGKRQELIFELVKACAGADGLAAEDEVIRRAVKKLPKGRGAETATRAIARMLERGALYRDSDSGNIGVRS